MPQLETEETLMDSQALEYDVRLPFRCGSFLFTVRSSLLNRVLFGLLVSYFLVTAGVIYDIIVEPPSVGQ